VRPIFRPGLHILRRDLRTLQLGLEWPGVAALRDTPAIRAVLEAVDGYRDAAGVVRAAVDAGVARDDAHAAVEGLFDAGALADQSVRRPANVEDGLWAGLWLLAGPTSSAIELFAARRRARVFVAGDGRLGILIRSLLDAEHVGLTDEPDEATLLVQVSDREPSRPAADDAMRRGVPFLCVGIRELVGVVGPFVWPGRTACLRCVDLSRAERDPCWTTLLDSLRATPTATASYPPSLAAATAAYAASEIAVWASGASPVCCDSVVEIPHGLGEVQTISFPPHPQCGCGWLGSAGRMEA
jgi:bacteriocin biosynthesis cyclodehydratase domain-containing protein